QRDPKTLAEQLRRGQGQSLCQLELQCLDIIVEGRRQNASVLLVPEVEHSLNARRKAEQPGAPVVDPPRQRTARELERGPALTLRLGFEEVGKTLSLGEVYASVEEGPARE